MPYGTSTPALSTSSSSRGLTLTMGYLILRGASRLDAFSVYPEPGSNSHVQFSVQFCANAFLSVCVSYLKDFTVFIGCSLYYAKNFTRLTAFAIWLFKKSSGLVILFNYQGSLWFFFAISATAHLIYHSCLRLSSTFFNFFCFFLRNYFSIRKISQIVSKLSLLCCRCSLQR